MFTPYIEQGEIANLPTFNYYIRLAAVKSQEPLSGETLLRDDGKYPQSGTARNRVVNYSRNIYARKYVPEVVVKTKLTKSTPKVKVAKETAKIVVRRRLPGEE